MAEDLQNHSEAGERHAVAHPLFAFPVQSVELSGSIMIVSPVERREMSSAFPDGCD